MSNSLCTVILAAGEGTRMRSPRPKPLHLICGRPMAHHVMVATTSPESVATVVVVGHEALWVEKVLRESDSEVTRLFFAEQREQLGTGHAVMAALSVVDEVMPDRDGDVIIVPGDTPLLTRSTVAALVAQHRVRSAALTVLTARVANPSGYGRIVRGRDGKVAKIVEQRDASAEEQAIDEINTGIMVVRHSMLGPALRLVGRQNSQNEYYLTDLVDVLYRGGHVTAACEIADAAEAAGVNDREQLASAESVMRQRINAQWLRAGVTMWDPNTTYIDSDVQLAADVTLWPGTVLRGRTTVAAGADLGPNALVDNSEVGPRSRIESATVLGATVGADCHVGSYVRLDVGTVLADGTRVLA